MPAGFIVCWLISFFGTFKNRFHTLLCAENFKPENQMILEQVIRIFSNKIRMRKLIYELTGRPRRHTRLYSVRTLLLH